MVIGLGRPQGCPNSSRPMRQGSTTTTRCSAAAGSSRNIRVPVLFRRSPSAKAAERTAGSTSRRRVSSSVAQAGCRLLRRLVGPTLPVGPGLPTATLRYRVEVFPVGGWPASASWRAGELASVFTVAAMRSVSSSSAGSSSGTTSSVTGVCSAMPASSPRRSISSNTAATIAQGRPARPSGLVQRLSRIMPPRRLAESSSKT